MTAVPATATPELQSAKTTCTRDEHAAQLRRWAVTDAVSYLVLGAPNQAYDRLVESVLGEQARLAGIRVPLHG